MAFPDDPRDVMVGFAFGEPASADPTAAVYEQVSPNANDPNDPGPVLGGVTITRGRIGDAATTEPTRIETALRNTGGEFSPRNVTGPRFGTLRKGTPMQVQVDAGSGPVVRGRGAVPDWNPTWAGPNIDDRLPVRALGVLSRLGRMKIDQSALRRYYDRASPRPAAYYPMEDGPNTTRFINAIGGASLPVTRGAQRPAAEATLPGSAPLPVAVRESTEYDRLTLVAPLSIPSGSFTVSWWVKTAIFGGSTNLVSTSIRMDTGTGGDYRRWVFGSSSSQSAGQTSYFGYPGSVNTDDDIAPSLEDLDIIVDTDLDPEWRHLTVTVDTSGPDLRMRMWVNGVLVATATDAGSLRPIQNIEVRIAGTFDDSQVNAAIGHIVVWDGAVSTTNDVEVGLGYLGESAADRITRLCVEESLPFGVFEGPSTPMGPQRPGVLLDLLRECEAADHGILYELLDGRLGYIPLSALYNRAVAMQLDYGTEDNPGNCNAHPVDDDRDLYNIVTVRRPDGAEAVAELQDGPAGTSESVGVGPRPMPPRTLNIAADDQAVHHASWLLHETTTDKPRALVTIDLRATPEIIDDWLACDIGSRITVANPPAQHFGPDPLDLIIVGYVETLDADRWQVLLYCEPYAPYKVGKVEGPGRLQVPAGTAIAEDLTTTETDVTVSAAVFSSSAVPYDVEVGGERMTVTAVSGTTLTVTRSVNGVVKSHSSGDAIRIADPIRTVL